MSASFVADTACRLDEFLRDKLDGTGRARAKKLCAEGIVRVNGRRAVAGLFLNAGDTVTVESGASSVRARYELGDAEKSRLVVLFEDEHLLAVQKPRGMHSVTLAKDDPLTVADCVAAIAPACRDASHDLREAGLVQRLDFYTSGVLLAAKSNAVWEKLHQALKGRAVEKSYCALVEGRFSEKEIVANVPLLAVSGGRVMRGAEQDEDGLAAKTKFCLEEKIAERSASLVQATASGARRHQIRAHAAHLGFPLVGDTRYGATSRLSAVQDRFTNAEGFYLHAQSIRLQHPETRAELEILCEDDIVA